MPNLYRAISSAAAFQESDASPLRQRLDRHAQNRRRGFTGRASGAKQNTERTTAFSGELQPANLSSAQAASPRHDDIASARAERLLEGPQGSARARNEYLLEKQSVSGERGCERVQRWRDPYTPASRRPACQGGERREQQRQLTHSEARNEDLCQPRTRPAAPGQALIECVEACGNRLRPGSAATAPDGRMLEQPSEFRIGRHVDR